MVVVTLFFVCVTLMLPFSSHSQKPFVPVFPVRQESLHVAHVVFLAHTVVIAVLPEAAGHGSVVVVVVVVVGDVVVPGVVGERRHFSTMGVRVYDNIIL